MESISLGLLAELFKSQHWTLPNDNVTLETLIQSELQARNQLLHFLQSSIQPPSPTVTPPGVTPTVSAPSTPDDVITEDTPVKKCRRAPMSPTKTYSDCEKKHFLDVAYENNWGTTVAANKFTRIWGKGPTRRMFYWWREQFKRDHDRDHKTMTALKDRKTELSLELNQFCQNQENMLVPSLAERAKQCLAQLEAVDGEIENFMAKKQKMFCTITGEKCIHGDGIQEENPIARKFTTPFICEFCKMPFQKDSTCLIHQKLCESRFINQIHLSESQKSPKLELPVIPKPAEPVIPTYETYNSELTDLAEQLIARLAECAATVPQLQ